MSTETTTEQEVSVAELSGETKIDVVLDNRPKKSKGHTFIPVAALLNTLFSTILGLQSLTKAEYVFAMLFGATAVCSALVLFVALKYEPKKA